MNYAGENVKESYYGYGTDKERMETFFKKRNK